MQITIPAPNQPLAADLQHRIDPRHFGTGTTQAFPLEQAAANLLKERASLGSAGVRNKNA